MPSIILFPHEARAAAAGTLRQVWRPVSHPPFDPCDDGIELEFHLGNLKPPFQPGDVLTCREAWRTEELESGLDGVRFRADGAFVEISNTQAASEKWMAADENGRFGSKWRSPATMPRWAVRSHVKALTVAVRRVQEMTTGDAKEWAVPFGPNSIPSIPGPLDTCGRIDVSTLWNSRFARRGLGWDRNPWCWAYSTEQAGRPEAL